MRKEVIKKIRNKMIYDMWQLKKAEWEMCEVAYLFGVSLPQVYRIIKAEDNSSKKIK